MPKRKMKMGIQSWLFLAFLLVVIAGSVLEMVPLWIAGVLAFIVAMVNITQKETLKTLVAALVLVVGGGYLLTFETIPVFGIYIGPVAQNLGAFLGTIGVITAIKEIVLRSKD